MAGENCTEQNKDTAAFARKKQTTGKQVAAK